jgi:hypothetical protein
MDGKVLMLPISRDFADLTDIRTGADRVPAGDDLDRHELPEI